MEASIFEIIKASQRQIEEIKKGNNERREQYRAELEKLYIDGALSKYGITKEQAINIKLNDVQTKNNVYYANIKFFCNLARWYVRNEQFREKTKIVDVEDIINQIYVDLRYYDYTNEKTFKSGLYITCRTINNGGYVGYKKWREEKKASKFLQDEIFSHNSKIDDATSLDELLSADERTTNPETMIIEKEQRESEKIYRQSMLSEILMTLPKSKRRHFMELFGDDEE